MTKDKILEWPEMKCWADSDPWVEGFDAGVSAQMDPEVQDGGYMEKWYRNSYPEGSEDYQLYLEGWREDISCG